MLHGSVKMDVFEVEHYDIIEFIGGRGIVDRIKVCYILVKVLIDIFK